MEVPKQERSITRAFRRYWNDHWTGPTAAAGGGAITCWLSADSENLSIRSFGWDDFGVSFVGAAVAWCLVFVVYWLRTPWLQRDEAWEFISLEIERQHAAEQRTSVILRSLESIAEEGARLIDEGDDVDEMVDDYEDRVKAFLRHSLRKAVWLKSEELIREDWIQIGTARARDSRSLARSIIDYLEALRPKVPQAFRDDYAAEPWVPKY